jgi:hypothetical protein
VQAKQKEAGHTGLPLPRSQHIATLYYNEKMNFEKKNDKSQ